ncbi:MAG: FG-GAP repeat protein, partial [Actinobacteria bacterium]|nr:FG-GAP repeat protein [Actinomycetota bacterium]
MLHQFVPISILGSIACLGVSPAAFGDCFLEESAKLLGSEAGAGDRVGYSVAISGDVVVVGAPYDDESGLDAGAVYVYRSKPGGWIEEARLLASDGAPGDGFGVSVAISGDVIVAGAWFEDENGSDAGAAYVFLRSGNAWTEVAKL